MTITAAMNFSGISAFSYATEDGDQYDRMHVAGPAIALDAHDHGDTKGTGVARLQTSAAPDAAGEVQITGDTLKYWAASAGAVYTAVTLAGTQTVSGDKTFTGALVLPQSATPTPTAEGSIAWDTDDNRLAIGDGAGTKLIDPRVMTTAGDTVQGGASGVPTRLAIGTAYQAQRVNAGATAMEYAGGAGGAVTFQNAADVGLKAQKGGTSGTTTATGVAIAGTVDVAVSFTSTFGTTPKVIVGGTLGTPASAFTISTTGFTMRLHGDSTIALRSGDYIAIG